MSEGKENLLKEKRIGPTARKQRRFLWRFALVCVSLFVLAICWAIATGRPLPDILGTLLSVAVSALWGL